MISNLSKAKFLFWSPKFPKLILNLAYKNRSLFEKISQAHINNFYYFASLRLVLTFLRIKTEVKDAIKHFITKILLYF